MIAYGDSKAFHAMAENLIDVQAWLNATPRRWSSSYSVSPMGTGWDLGVGFDGALRLAREGWSDGAKSFADKLAAHMPPHNKTASWRYDVAGELPDIGRFLAGDPAHMRRHGHPKGHKPVINIAVNNALSSAASAQQMTNYGAALVAIIDKIENAGRRVELTVHNVTNCSGARVSVGWVVKYADDAFDLASVAFSLAHPASVRRIVFAMMERSTTPTSAAYGRPVEITEADLVDPAPDTFLIPGIMFEFARCKTFDGAMQLAMEQINKAAGEELVTLED